MIMSLNVVICPKCAGDIEIGIAIRPNMESYCNNFQVSLLKYEDVKLMDVYKCKNCGYSYVETHQEYEL
jgi:predicted RNA-binding Zn-ribbon protein involved in translation (DUF1610 family)